MNLFKFSQEMRKLDGGRKYKVALFILAFVNVQLFAGNISEQTWFYVIIGVGSGYALFNQWSKKR